MIRFASLDSLLRVFVTGLILIVVFGLARSSPSALRSYEPPVLNGAPALTNPAVLQGLSTPSVVRLLAPPGARLIAGPGSSTFHWSGLTDEPVGLTWQPVPPANPATGMVRPAVSGPAVRGQDDGHKAHGGATE